MQWHDVAKRTGLAEAISGKKLSELGAVYSLVPIRPWDRTISPLSRLAVPEYIQQEIAAGHRDRVEQQFSGHPMFAPINDANALLGLEDWRGAAKAYRKVMTLYPDYGEGYSLALALYHEKLFAYSEAFALTQQWLERHPDDLSAQANFAEAYFTTGRSAEAETRIAALLANPQLDSSSLLGLRTLHVATLLAMKKQPSLFPPHLPRYLILSEASVPILMQTGVSRAASISLKTSRA
jgi:tetratricopeptide (TPR) repeat protein